jgi:hypothetical protein
MDLLLDYARCFYCECYSSLLDPSGYGSGGGETLLMNTVIAPNRVALADKLFKKDGLIVEVGVQWGRFASELLETCSPRCLFLVDAWRHLPGEWERDPANVDDAQHQKAYEAVCRGIGRAPNVLIMRMLSAEAALFFADSALDAVYIDCDHTRPGITGDLERWWPKIKPGGWLSGHDYIPRRPRRWVDVTEVLHEWTAVNGLDFVLSGEDDWQSWAIHKS